VSKLEASVADAALAHARRDYPCEACGLVVIKKGRQVYMPCKNTDAQPEAQFSIDPLDFAKCEEEGEVVAIFHSHPNASAQPSSTDRSSCNASDVPWHIVSLPIVEWVTLMPVDVRSMPLYGREFVHGTTDCYGFIQAWYQQELGIELGDIVRSDEWWRHGENLYLDNYAAQGMQLVTDGSLNHGDVLLMQVLASVPNHAAIYLDGNVIAHHLYGRLSGRDVYGGYYKKHTTHTLRHKR
jgi:proteasome lid subunit RPN8/RPN11